MIYSYQFLFLFFYLEIGEIINVFFRFILQSFLYAQDYFIDEVMRCGARIVKKSQGMRVVGKEILSKESLW